MQKAAGGVAIWAVGVMLALTGFEPNVVQSESTLFGMLLLAAALPCFLLLGAIAMLTRFSLDEAGHRAALAAASTR